MNFRPFHLNCLNLKVVASKLNGNYIYRSL
jgi:hypothetical protein